MFRRRGVSVGDHLYIVTVLSGCLYLAGKMEIGEIISFEEASRRLNDKNLFKASDHLLARRVTPLDYALSVPLQITARLKFFLGRRLSSLKFTEPGRLDTQTLRGIRRMPEETARMLDNLLPPLENCC